MELITVFSIGFLVILVATIGRLWFLNSLYLNMIKDHEAEIDTLITEINGKNDVLEDIWNTLQEVKKSLTSNPEMNFYYEKNAKVAEFFNMIDSSLAEVEKVYNKLRMGVSTDAKEEHIK